jgi:HD-like signal output (HDOD) protein
MDNAMNDQRIEELRVTLADPAVGRYAGNVSDLPSLPETYTALSRAASDPKTSVGTIADIIESDPVISVRLLQLVNSAFFGMTQRTSSIPKAVSIMGTNLLKSLVLSAHMCNAIERFPTRSFSMSRYQQYAIRVARLARRMAGSRACADDAFTAGIMLGIGQLVFALKAPELFERVLQRVATTGELQHNVELELMGTTRAEVGALLLSNWGIPFTIVECVALHLRPSAVGPGSCELLALVHAADALTGIIACREAESRLDLQFLSRAGLIDEVPRWRRLAETAGEGETRLS